MTTEIKYSYQVLELEPGASLEQVKEAWRELVKVWHPDRFPNDPKMQRKAQERLKNINGAYEILCEFLASNTGSNCHRTTSLEPDSRDGGSSDDGNARRDTPSGPSMSEGQNMSKSGPKKSRAKMILLLILLFIFVGYCINLIIQYGNFSNQLTAVNGVHLGDSHAEVKYRLGFPQEVFDPKDTNNEFGDPRLYFVFESAHDQNEMPTNTSVEDYGAWVYEETNNSVRLTVEFSASGLVQSLNLYSDNSNADGWGPVAGLYSGDSENKVLKLGPPSQQSLDGVSKTIEYRDIGVIVTLTKGRAYMITIERPLDNSALFWRFLRSHYGHG